MKILFSIKFNDFHSTVKPDNILLSSNTQWPILVIADLGLSKILTENNTICGTIEYSAPELLERNENYGQKVDLWSCGVVLYTMLTGCQPFSDAYAYHHNGRNMVQQIIAGNVALKHQALDNVSKNV
jgi:serine/threonine protein kinase